MSAISSFKEQVWNDERLMNSLWATGTVVVTSLAIHMDSGWARSALAVAGIASTLFGIFKIQGPEPAKIVIGVSPYLAWINPREGRAPRIVEGAFGGLAVAYGAGLDGVKAYQNFKKGRNIAGVAHAISGLVFFRAALIPFTNVT